MISSIQRSGRRKQKRRPAGWLMVELESGSLGRYVSGRLIDTSAGGLGLIVDQPLPDGTRVRVTRAATTGDGGTHVAGQEAVWERREARTVHAMPLPEGGYRLGLVFRPALPAARELWSTRALLFGVILVIAVPSVLAGGMGGWLIAAIMLTLEFAAEWHFRSETRNSLAAQKRWDEDPEPVHADTLQLDGLQPGALPVSPTAVA